MLRGSAPDRRLIIEYYNNDNVRNGYNFTLQIILYEGSNDIRFNYYTGVAAGPDVEVAGIENADGSSGLRYNGIYGDSFSHLSVLFYLDDGDVSPPPLPPAPQPQPPANDYPSVEDFDGDGYTSAQGDCNDDNATVYPGAVEICGDGIDNNCNGLVDENCESENARKLYFPLLSEGEPFIGLVNPSDEKVTGILRAYDDQGELLGESDEIEIVPHGRIVFNSGELFSLPSDSLAYLIFEGDGERVDGYCRIVDQVSGGAASYPALLPVADARNLYIPSIKSGDGWSTEISFVMVDNPAKFVKATLTYNNGDTEVFSLLPKGGLCHLQVDRPGIESAVVKLSNFGDPVGTVVGAVLYRKNSRLMAATELRNGGENNLTMPYLAEQEGWWSSVVFYNPPTSESSEQCIFEGVTRVRGEAPVSMEEFSLSEAQVEVVVPQKIAPGAYAMEIGNECPLLGTAYIGQGLENVLGAFTVTGQTLRQGVFARVLVAEDDEGGWSGVVLYNPNENRASITLTAYDDGGEVVAEKEFALEAHDELVGLPVDLFDGDLGNITHMEFTADQGIYGLLLNLGIDNDLEMLDILPPLAE